MIRDLATRYFSNTSQDRAIRLLLVAFMFVCVFDPADKTLRAKIPLFVALWAVTLLRMLERREIGSLVKPAIYVAIFTAIPALSILRFYILGGHLPPQGLALLKGYLLVSLVLVLIVHRIDAIPRLSAVLTILACSVIAVFVASTLDYDLFVLFSEVGLRMDVLRLGKRSYGEFELLLVFFVTSPMLVIPIAHYFDRAMTNQGIAQKLPFIVLTAINITGMFLAGTRNNIMISILLPFLLWPLYTRRVAFSTLCSLAILAILALPFVNVLQAFIDPDETANNIKLVALRDYLRIFSDPATLLLGQGLGTNYDWTVRGNFYITELTYLEMVRNFGLVGALIMLALLLFPIGRVFFAPSSRHKRSLAMAYFLYLVMSASNPILFSSMGILILAILVANDFQRREREDLSPIQDLVDEG